MLINLPDCLEAELPKAFDYPFYYSPQKLALNATIELMDELENKSLLQHDFTKVGKMFGVLVVKNQQGNIGYLRGFSGVLMNQEKPKSFVPHIQDSLKNLEYITSEKEYINQLTTKIDQFDIEKIKSLKKLLSHEKNINNNEIIKLKQTRKKNKALRKEIREKSYHVLSPSELDILEADLVKQSLYDKFICESKTKEINTKFQELKEEVELYTAPYDRLYSERKKRSKELHDLIFKSYLFLNKDLEKKSLQEIFEFNLNKRPPAGAGDCALPKMLQFAFQNKLTPLCFNEFWWGAPHKSEIRKHKNFYHACTGKCKPILNHMLKGLPVSPNPMLEERSHLFKIEKLYEDNDIIVIIKPSGILSVPGKEIKDSVYTRVKDENLDLTGPIIVHRLDQDTSGIMVLAKNERSYHNLQDQFIRRTVKKTYTALLEGFLEDDDGEISLPLRVDLDNRPHQVICYKYGKNAKTKYRVLERRVNSTLVYFYPHTGRTHQLRVHAAHQDGLNAPIKGDDLYGKKGKRLCLHASELEFIHPVTNNPLTFTNQIEF